MDLAKSADILSQLLPERLELFRKTKLYKHFEAELVIPELDKSEIYMEFDNVINRNYLYFNVFKYDNAIRVGYSCGTFEQSWVHAIGNYLNCRCYDLRYLNYDIRYYKDHPYDSVITIKAEQNWSIIYEDYQYWLIQGNKPRYMYYGYNGITTIPDEIIFLYLDNHDENIRVPIPEQILFLISKNITNPDQLIAYYRVDIEEELKFMCKEKSLIWEAFHDYNFRKRSKSAYKI
jgi:hypothetical protein